MINLMENQLDSEEGLFHFPDLIKTIQFLLITSYQIFNGSFYNSQAIFQSRRNRTGLHCIKVVRNPYLS